MKNLKRRNYVLSQKTIRKLAILFVALTAASAILILGGVGDFEVEWSELWNNYLT